MASKLGILGIAFLSIIFLPLLSSSAFSMSGLQAHPHRRHHRRRHHLFRPHQFPDMQEQKTNSIDQNGGDNNEKTPTFFNPAFDEELRKNEEAQPEEGGNDKTPNSLNPEEELRKNEEPQTEEGGNDEDKEPRNNEEPQTEKRENDETGDNNEKTPSILDPAVEGEPRNNVEPQPEERGKGGLREAFYVQSCPQAEKIANETIHKHFRKDPSLAPAFVRLFFHDCFVTGCDGSVLLDETPTGEDVEKKAGHNGPLVRGFETIDDIKTKIEAECPGVVSCADILAFANRDSLAFTGLPNYEVAAGRRDGLASLAKNVDGNLPTPQTPAEQNIEIFQKKGMSLEDLVVLVGAHSIGSAHCTLVSPRFRNKEKSKEIDPGYLFKMQTVTMCQNDDQVVPFDPYSQHQMDSRYYKELLTNRALIESDHKLAKEVRTRNVMNKLVDDQEGWLAKFTIAIKKLGEVEVLTGDQGEIRKQCRAVNGDA